MAPSSYEMAASILLCAEDSSSILDLEAEAEEEEVMLARSSRTRGDPSVVFPVPSEECVAGFVEAEAAHMPREDYAERLRGGGMDLRVRMDAVDWIWKVGTRLVNVVVLFPSMSHPGCFVMMNLTVNLSTGSHVLRFRPSHCLLGRQLLGPLPLALPASGKNQIRPKRTDDEVVLLLPGS
jgi:hypothetical protein